MRRTGSLPGPTLACSSPTERRGDVEPSEVAFGAADTRRMLEPLSWSSVYRPDLGYWVVPILAVRVDGVELDFCKDGTCRGVVDTGTSHLGVPGPHDKELQELLKVDAGDLLDCRLAKSPKLEIELEGKTIDLFASSYMRRLPLREDVSVSSDKGVTLDDEKTKKLSIGPATLWSKSARILQRASCA
ncbi:unnamed protein product [Effrenium voratum]|nr:unnamed protein product [Effrenium voratum]